LGSLKLIKRFSGQKKGGGTDKIVESSESGQERGNTFEIGCGSYRGDQNRNDHLQYASKKGGGADGTIGRHKGRHGWGLKSD